MLNHRRFRLRTLGELTLGAVVGESESAASVRPRHLAVLTVLALAKRPIPRDSLLEMFWGGETESRARHSLSNALSALRSEFGPAAITARRDHVALSADAFLDVDAVEFSSAIERGDDTGATTVYSGAFLDGVYIGDAPEFEHWASRERARLELMFVDLCSRQVPRLIESEDWNGAATLAERWLMASPHSSDAFRAVLQSLSAPGTAVARASAVDAYERLQRMLATKFESSPDRSVVAFVESLRAQLLAVRNPEPRVVAGHPEPRVVAGHPGPRVVAGHPGPPVAAGHPEPPKAVKGSLSLPRSHVVPTEQPRLESDPFGARAPQDDPRQFAPQDDPRQFAPRDDRARRTPRWRWMFAAATAVVAIAAGRMWTNARNADGSVDLGRPTVAITAVDNVRGDTSIEWLRAGLPRMIAADLDATGAVEVVPPSHIREVIARFSGSPGARLSTDQAADVARRVGATWSVSGGVSATRDGYLLDLSVRNVSNQGENETFTILSKNPIELGRLAATRLAQIVDVHPSEGSARYSGIETASPDAYRHFGRGMLAYDAERFPEAARELDSAIAIDSAFVEAIRARRSVAGATGDDDANRRLASLERRYANRLPEIERLSDEIRNVDSLGESTRANALSIALVRRFPHDPRAYNTRADLLVSHGRWAEADTLLVRELALDSLAMVAGNGPCTPCEVLWRLSQTRLAEGDPRGAEAAARRWIELQPDLPSAWRNLSATLAAVGRASEAEAAGFHMVALSKESIANVDFARTMLSARRLSLVDSLLATWRGSNDPILVAGLADIGAMLQRERGQIAASVDDLARLSASNGLSLVRADGLARLGKSAEARAILESVGHPEGSSRTGQLTAPEARGFSWSHALEADERLRAGDTTGARALADSIEQIGQQSYYGRDKLLHHHVRGMLDFTEGNFAGAERELRRAEWAANGWTRTNVELARAQSAQGHYDAAIATLRNAYLAPLDAMARYVPRSELDWWLARTFAAAGRADSAAVYARYVRAAWQRADPAVRARLDSLPR